MAEPINSAEEVVQNTEVERTQLTSDDIMQLLTSALESGEPFATEFNRKVVKPLAQKIDAKLYVTAIKVDGETIGQHITDVLKQETLNPLKQVSKKVAKTLKDINQNSELFKIKEGGVTFSDLFGGLDTGAEELTSKRWNLLQRNIITKIKKALPDEIKFSEDDTLTVDALFGNVKGSEDTDKQWSALQRSVIARVKKGLPEDADFGGSILGAADEMVGADPAEAGPSTGKFRSLVKETPSVIIEDINPDVFKKLSEAFSFENVLSFEDVKPPSWLKDLLLAGAALVGLGAASAMYGLFTTGPLKGTMKLISRITIPAGLKLSKLFVKGASTWIESIVKNFGDAVPKMFKTMFEPVVKIFSKGVGKSIVKHGLVKPGLFKLLGKQLFKKLGKSALKKIPVLGLLLSLGFAYSRFKSGDIVGGLIEVASGIASTFPLVGTAIAIGLDVLNAWLDISKGGSTAETSVKKGASIGNFFKKGGAFFKGIGAKIATWWKSTGLYQMGAGISKMMGGSKMEGFKEFVTGFGRTIPFPLNVAFLDLFNWITSIDETSKEYTASHPKQKFSFTTFLMDVIKKKMTKDIKLMPWWVKKAFKYFGIDVGDTGEPDDTTSPAPTPLPPEKSDKATGTVKTAGAEKPFELVWDNPPMGSKDDFIWRSGGGIQPFNAEDNMVSVKDDKTFETILESLNGKKEDDKTELYMKQLIETVESLAGMVASNNVESTVTGIPPVSDDIRDPAYVLRTRVWDRLRTGYSG